MKKKFLLGVGLALALLASANFSRAQNRTTSSAAGQSTIALKTLEGNTLASADLKGQVTVLAVGATWLPLSREQVAIANQLHQNYAARGVKIYFVTTDSVDPKSKNFADDRQLKSFVERYKISFNVLRDTTGSTLKTFKIDQIPAFVILDKNGELAAVIAGLDVENNDAAAAQIAAQINQIL